MDKKGWLGRGGAPPLVLVFLLLTLAGCTLSTGGDKSNTTPAASPPVDTAPVQQTPTFGGGNQVVYLGAQEGGTGPIGPI
ncbi:MAG: hypothetical protein EHM39_12845, partial [Chloroflexi bacterium]